MTESGDLMLFDQTQAMINDNHCLKENGEQQDRLL